MEELSHLFMVMIGIGLIMTAMVLPAIIVAVFAMYEKYMSACYLDMVAWACTIPVALGVGIYLSNKLLES